MSELVKEIKFYYKIFIIVCLTTIYISYSSKSNLKYVLALKNLELFGKNGVLELSNYIKKNIISEFKNEDIAFHEETQRDFYFSVKEALSAHKIKIDSQELYRYPLRGIHNYNRPNYFIDLPDTNNEITISEIIHYLERDKKIGQIELLPHNSEIIYKVFADYINHNNLNGCDLILEKIRLNKSEIGRGIVLNLNENISYSNVASLSFVLSEANKSKVEHLITIELPMTYKVFESGTNKIINDWFFKKSINQDEFIRSIEKCGDEIKHLNICSALNYVEKKNVLISENVNFFGFAIDKKSFLLFAPLIILFDLLILFGLFRSLIEFAKKNHFEESKLQEIYFPLINGYFVNKLIYISSLTLLPFITIIMLNIFLDYSLISLVNISLAIAVFMVFHATYKLKEIKRF
jgi:hypothetical protein